MLLVLALPSGDVAALRLPADRKPTFGIIGWRRRRMRSMRPEVDQAEAAMQQQDFTTAETLLQKAVAANPDDYRAWFDLGLCLQRQAQRTHEAIDAYRKAVAAKPDVFESNLNLGVAAWPARR